MVPGLLLELERGRNLLGDILDDIAELLKITGEELDVRSKICVLLVCD